MASENDLATARRLMTDVSDAVGTADGLQRVCEGIYAAVGIHRGEDLLSRYTEDPYPAWRWLTEVIHEAGRQQDSQLVARIFAFTTFWHTSVAPKLGPADWMDLLLPDPPEDMRAAITTDALPHLLRMSPDQVVTGNATGQVPAQALAEYAASQVLDSPERYPDALAATAKNVLDPQAITEPTQAEAPSSLLAPAIARLDRVKTAISEVGLRYVDFGEAVVGVGIGLSWGETDWVVVSVAAGGLEDVVNITAGVLMDLARDRMRILEECNTRTRENTVHPVYLHDAQEGWDVLVQQRFHIDVLLANPTFLRNTLANLPIYARQTRDEFREHGLSGKPTRGTPRRPSVCSSGQCYEQTATVRVKRPGAPTRPCRP